MSRYKNAYSFALILFFLSACGSVGVEGDDVVPVDLESGDVVLDSGSPDVSVSEDTQPVDQGADISGTPDGSSDQGVSDTNVEDLGDGDTPDAEPPNCSGDTPVECSNILENGKPTCYPENTDCNTIQLDASGGLVWCKIGDEPHINDDGLLQCCGGESPLWCEPSETVPGYAGWCHPAGTDCSTLKQCGSGIPEACLEGSESFCRGDGKVSCCGGETPFWCPPFGDSVGFCRPENAGCNEAVSCDGGESWGVCSFGVATNCSTDGDLYCCAGDTPKWCAPGSGVNPSFPGRCFPVDTHCDLVGPGPDNSWLSCSLSETATVDVYGNLICCGGELPIQCDNYAGQDATYDGSQCFAAGTDCDSLTKNSESGLWDSCEMGQEYGIAANGALVCCASSNPVYCPSGVSVADGDSAFNFSVSEVTPTNACEESCSIDADCFGSVPPLKCKGTPGESYVDSDESGFYEEGEEFTDMNGNGVYDAAGCNQCVANDASFSFDYIGGCWEAGSLCTRIHFCGGAFKQCGTDSCYCWNGILIEQW